MSEYKNVMLAAPDDIKAEGIANYNLSDDIIGSAIRTSQNVYLRDIIGTEFLTRLQQLVWNSINNLEDNINEEKNIAYKELLDDYIVPLITYRTCAELCNTATYKLRNFGLIQNSDTNVNSVTITEVVYMKQNFETLFNDAANRMVEFLCENDEAFPESDFVCSCKSHPIFARTGLWLGPSKR